MRLPLASFDAKCADLSRDELVLVRERLLDLLSITETHLGHFPVHVGEPSRGPFMFGVLGVIAATAISYWNWM